MDLCSLEDAFPNINEGSVSGFPSVGGKDTYSSREERRAARRLAKKAKGPALAYSDSISTDPDRPSVQRMEPIETVAEVKEEFKLPVLPKASCLFSDTGTPPYFGNVIDDSQANKGSTSSYFGRGIDDSIEEAFASYSAAPKDDTNYRLQPDFTKSDLLKGAEKAAGQPLPEPPLNDSWKPMTHAASYTAYYNDTNMDTKRVEPKPESPVKAIGSGSVNEGSSQDALLKRIDMLMARLDQLERKNVRDSQTEILMFVGTGLFVLVSFELFARR